MAVTAKVARAVEPGQLSRTSLSQAARRVQTARDRDPKVANPDWVAVLFLGPDERKFMAGEPVFDALDMDFTEAQKVQPENAGQTLIRTRYIDERLQLAIAGGARQVVILGAGLDSRAYRMRELLQGVKVFEVDYGPTQEHKKGRVKQVFGCLPADVAYVPIDFTRENLNDVLVNAGHDKNIKTFYIWEGVTYYLPEQAIRETLRFVSGSAPGSAIVFDAKRKSFIDWLTANVDYPGRVPPAFRTVLTQEQNRRKWKEPWIFGFPDGREAAFFESVGLRLIDMLRQDGPEANKRYLTRQDRSVAFSVSEPDRRAPTQVGYVAEVVVPPR